MAALVDLVKQYFDENEWEYEQSPEHEGTFLSGVETDNGEFDVVILADDDMRQVVCFCAYPDEVPEDRLRDVAEYVARVNNTTVFGMYDLDFDDGAVRVRTSLNIADMAPTPAFIAMLVQGTISTADVYYPGLQMVIDGEKSPEDAFDDILAELDESGFLGGN